MVARRRTFVDQADFLRLLQEGSGTREGITVECLGFPELTFKLAKMTSRLVELRLLQKSVLVDGTEKIGQRVLDRLANEVFALAMKETLLAVDVVLILKRE